LGPNQSGAEHRLDICGVVSIARLFAWWGHLHGTRSGFEQCEHAGAATGTKRTAHHALYGALAGIYRWGHHLPLRAWDAKPVEGQTLNAVVFHAIISHLGWGTPLMQNALLALVLAFEAGLLLVGAQTGFLDGPAVLSNMAGDYWVPRYFRDLSARLVRQNGIIVMGVASLLILSWTHGDVSVLVVLYRINVFLTFSLSLLGLCIYWWRHRKEARIWLKRLFLSAMGLTVTATVLVITLFEKFMAGGWLTVVVTSAVIGLCLLIKRHYVETRKNLTQADAVKEYRVSLGLLLEPTPELNSSSWPRKQWSYAHRVFVSPAN
jgi:amino acid transporter